MLREVTVGAKPADMSVNEYEKCVRSIKRRNKVKRIINLVLLKFKN